MAGLFDKQSELYATARPNYRPEWFARLATLTTHHKLVWDVGTGNGQAAVCVAEHYDMVIATDVSEAQIRCATVHPKVRYVHTSVSTAADELVRLLGGEGMVDLVIVALAVHWFDLPFFYSVATRVLRKIGGVIALWGYNDVEVSPVFDSVFQLFHATTLPYWDPRIRYLFDAYRTLPFPFESVGVGSEGNPEMLDLEKELSFDGFMDLLGSWSAVLTAKQLGVDLLGERVVNELREAWCSGHSTREVKKITYKAFMLAGTPKLECK